MKKINLIFVSFSIFLLMLMGVRFQQAYAVSVKVTDEFLEEQATDIIKGKVVSLESKWTAEGIITNVGIKVDKSIKGKHGNRITLEVLGGVVGEIGLFVSESPRFSMGEEVKLFLKQKKPGIYKVTGGRQGKKRISSGTAPISIVPQSTNRYRRYFVYLDWDYMESPMGVDILINEELAEDAEARIKAAANEWNTIGAANFQFTFGELTDIYSISRYAPDGYNVVCMEQLDDIGENVLAVAYYWFYTTTGDIIEADCGIDEDWIWYLGEETSGILPHEYDLQGIITHEFGHFLSLVDVYDDYTDDTTHEIITMYGYGSPGETYIRSLEPADIAGIQAIYGVRIDMHDVAVTAISAPSSVEIGYTASIKVTVANQGTYSETFDVVLTDDTYNVVIETKSVYLEAGTSTTLTYSWDTTSATTGDHTLTASLDFTDDNASNDSKSTTVAVTEAGGATAMYVDSIDMSTETRRTGRNTFTTAVATVKIVDASNSPVEGATVSSRWSGLTSDIDSGLTDSAGVIVLKSDRVKNASGTFIFTLYAVTKDGWTWYEEPSTGSISVP